MRKKVSVNLGNLLLSLSEIPDIANPSISQHQHRTAFIALKIVQAAGLRPEEIERIFMAALLHDIGAVTVEEKISVHNFKKVNENDHALKGEMLIEEIPWLRKISKIVGNHHKIWAEYEEGIDNQDAFAAQVILLSDYVERLILRDKYILFQNRDIIETIKKLESLELNKKVIEYFIDVSEKEEFWLDLVSPRLYEFLLNNGPFRDIQIDLDNILLISNLYRDLIDFKSRFTATHTAGVSACAAKIAELFGMAVVDVKSMRIAGNLHDIGKLVIPNSILEKPGKLTAQEFEVIKCHTYYTYHTINSIGGLQRIAEWAAFHHEKLDGSGYPFHCCAEEIGTGSRILTVADIFTAISEDRPYRKGMDKNQIYSIIDEQSRNGLLDKRVVELLFDNYDYINGYVKEEQAKSRRFYENRFNI